MLFNKGIPSVSQLAFPPVPQTRPGRRKSFAICACGLAALLTLAGCKDQKGGAASQMRPPEVAVVTMAPQSLALTASLPGRISAFLTAEIRPQVNGVIKERLFTEGATVKAGQVLYRIDPSTYQAALAQARANLAASEAKLPSAQNKADRYKELLASHAVSQQDGDDALAALRQVQAAIEADRAAVLSAKINLDYTAIVSPITGRIGKSSVTVGGLVNAYQATVLTTVRQLDPVYVDVVQSNAELLRLRHAIESGTMTAHEAEERKVKLYLEDGTRYPIEGTLQFRDVTVDTTTGSVTLRITFANPDQVLLPGMYVHALVDTGVKPDAILVPQQAVSRNPKGEPLAWVAGKDERVELRELQLDRAVGSQWVVSGGLAAGDRVIVEGGDRVRAGMKVHAVPFKAEAAGQPKAGQ